MPRDTVPCRPQACWVQRPSISCAGWRWLFCCVSMLCTYMCVNTHTCVFSSCMCLAACGNEGLVCFSGHRSAWCVSISGCVLKIDTQLHSSCRTVALYNTPGHYRPAHMTGCAVLCCVGVWTRSLCQALIDMSGGLSCCQAGNVVPLCVCMLCLCLCCLQSAICLC